MSEDPVKFVLPAEFILARTIPTPRELVYGFQHGWLDDDDAVRAAEAALSMGMTLPDAVEELALLLRDERYRVAELMGAAAEELSASDEPPSNENPSRLWLYLALDWLYEHRADFVEPLKVIEQLYADFNYPAEIEGLVRFMPPPGGNLRGLQVSRGAGATTSPGWLRSSPPGGLRERCTPGSRRDGFDMIRLPIFMVGILSAWLGTAAPAIAVFAARVSAAERAGWSSGTPESGAWWAKNGPGREMCRRW